MALLDTTIVNVALPSIRTSLAASSATLSWIVSGYALAFGLALIPAGRLGDRIGHKGVFIGGARLVHLGQRRLRSGGRRRCAHRRPSSPGPWRRHLFHTDHRTDPADVHRTPARGGLAHLCATVRGA